VNAHQGQVFAKKAMCTGLACGKKTEMRASEAERPRGGMSELEDLQADKPMVETCRVGRKLVEHITG